MQPLNNTKDSLYISFFTCNKNFLPQVNQFLFFLFRKLIEGEDTRLSTMVHGMSMLGASVSASLSTSGVRLSGALAEASGGPAAVSTKLQSPPSNGRQGATEEFEQAVEVTERKTVLIR